MDSLHPDDDTLRKLAAGLLDDAAAEQLAPHIDTCTEVCQPKLDRFTSGPPAGLPGVPGYTDLVEIGRGGMGVVYRATQTVLNRPVAVKTLRPEASPTRAAVLAARFGREARITGQLQHPGIPAVYDLSTIPDGRPYLAMKLIRGRTLADEIKTGPRDAAGLGRLVGYFEQVCQAVAYAHGHGVIHRDLKPQNVMIGAYGAVQVMDWGLAKLLDDREPATAGGEPAGTMIDPTAEADSVTGDGAVLGTPAYMPPEQAGGEVAKVDRRSDVFALGAVLCEILTGWPPYVGSSGQAVRLLATRWEAVEAFGRLDGCVADPEWVELCKRCLAKESADRPADAAEVAAVLAAVRTSAEERARQAEVEREKAAAVAVVERKRRRAQAVLAVSMLILFGLSGFGLWYADRKERDRETERRVEQGEREAERRSQAQATREQVEKLLALAKDLRLKYRFDNADNTLRQARDLAARGTPDLLPVVEQAQGDLAFVRVLDAVRDKRLAQIELPGGGGFRSDASGAAPAYRAAFEDRGLDVVVDPVGAGLQVDFSHVRAELIAALDDWLALEQSEPVRAAVAAVLRRVDPDSAVAPFRDQSLWQDVARLKALATALDPTRITPAAIVTISDLLHDRGIDVTPLLRSAFLLYPQDFQIAYFLGLTLPKEDPDKVGAYRAAHALRPDHAPTLTELGGALYSVKQYSAAAATARESIRLEPNRWFPYYNLGIALSKQGNLDGAIREYEKAIRLNPDIAMVHTSLGHAFSTQGNTDRAVQECEKAIRLDPMHGMAHTNLGNILLYKKGNWAGAAAKYQEAIRVNPECAEAHNGLGNVFYDKRELVKAEAEYKKAINLDQKFADPHNGLGNVLRRNGDWWGAIREYNQAIRLDPMDAQPHNGLANVLRDRKDVDGAILEYNEAILLSPKNAGFHANLGWTLVNNKKDYERGVAALEKAIDLEPENTQYAEALRVARGFQAEHETRIAPPPRLVVPKM